MNETTHSEAASVASQDSDRSPRHLIVAHEIASHFPLMCEQEFAEFKADIEAHGLLEPIWLYEGRVLDGRHRYRACRELDIEPELREYTGHEPVAFAVSKNGRRRHLTVSQRAALAVTMLPALHREATERQQGAQFAGRDTDGKPLRPSVSPVSGRPKNQHGSSVRVAGLVGVGKTIVEQALALQRKSPELFAQVQAGSIKVETAHKIARKTPTVSPPVILTPEQRLAELKRYAAQGQRTEQIAESMGIRAAKVSALAREAGITLPDAGILKSKKPNIRRVIEQMVLGLEGYNIGLGIIADAVSSVSAEDAAEWCEAINHALTPIHKLRNKLQGIVRHG